jgi:hypothetical protein
MKIRPFVDELFHADGETDMTKPIVAFRNFAKASKTTCYPRYILPVISLMRSVCAV